MDHSTRRNSATDHATGHTAGHTATTASEARRRHWRRDTVELSAVFVAAALADLIGNVVVRGHDGPELLITSALALLATAAWHGWWSHRHPHAPPGPAPGDIVSASGTAARSGPSSGAGSASGAASAGGAQGAAEQQEPLSALPPQELALWRIRATVSDAPGSLAALCRGLADLPVNIISMQAHPLADVTVDEFVVQARRETPAQEINRAVVAAGGTEVWLERADAHDLVDVPTRILNLATRTALDAAELPLALRQLFGRCSIRSLPTEIAEDDLDGSTMRLRDPSGGVLVVTRDQPPFTPTEFARARALIELDAQLGPRVPDNRDLLTLPAGNELTVRRADPSDKQAALALHERCSTGTLRLRYHGPSRDADRYLGHLLEPRYGQTLTVETADGELVALAHLMWDDGEAEIAVLVEDRWQRRGLGAELVRRLAGLARDAGLTEIYAVTTASNTGMVAALRRLGVPLDYQVEEGTLVITAHLAPTPAASRR